MDPFQPSRLSVKIHDDNEKQHNLVIKIKHSGIRLARFPDVLFINCMTLGKLLNLSVSLFFNLGYGEVITSTS